MGRQFGWFTASYEPVDESMPEKIEFELEASEAGGVGGRLWEETHPTQRQNESLF